MSHYQHHQGDIISQNIVQDCHVLKQIHIHILNFSFVIYFCSDVMISSIDTDITYEGLCAEVRDICKFDEMQPFTMKWVDEEGKKHRTNVCIYVCTITCKDKIAYREVGTQFVD